MSPIFRKARRVVGHCTRVELECSCSSRSTSSRNWLRGPYCYLSYSSLCSSPRASPTSRGSESDLHGFARGRILKSDGCRLISHDGPADHRVIPEERDGVRPGHIRRRNSHPPEGCASDSVQGCNRPDDG